jgi:RHS repeat-associated protein
VIATTYDALDRPVTRTGGYAWAYDQAGGGAAKGRVTRHAFPGGSDAYVYDFAGRIIQQAMVRGGSTEVVGATYDTTGVGRPLATIFADETVARTYDTAGRVTALTGLTSYASAIAYDAADHITAMTLGNGVVETYAYDGPRLASQKATKNLATLYSASYGYDANGAVKSLSSATNGVASNLAMAYDELGRLTAVTGSQSQSFAYDAIGNITSNSALGTYAYEDPAHVHAVTRAGTRTYAYDANGNMTQGNGRTLTWDVHDRLAQVTTASGTSTFAYDGGGKRIKQVTGGLTTQYFGDFVESDGTNVRRSILLGDRRIAQRAVGGGTTYFHVDTLGSTRLLTTSAGAVARTFDYAPFGSLRSTTGSGTTTAVRFGGYRSDHTGLSYLQARYYDPELGRFVSADSIVPAGTPQQLNRYTYANNSPYTYRDPSGRFSISGAISSVASAVSSAVSSAASAVRDYANSVRSNTGSSSSSANTGNNPGNPNAAGYHGGTSAGNHGGSSNATTGNVPGNPNAAGYHAQYSAPNTPAGSDFDLQPTLASCSSSGCTARGIPFESATGRTFGPNVRSADSPEDLYTHVDDELAYAGDIYSEDAQTHEINRYSFDNHVEGEWDTTVTPVRPDQVPPDTDIVVIDRPTAPCNCY